MLYCLMLAVAVVFFAGVLLVITYLALEKSGWFSLLYIPYFVILLIIIFYYDM